METGVVGHVLSEEARGIWRLVRGEVIVAASVGVVYRYRTVLCQQPVLKGDLSTQTDRQTDKHRQTDKQTDTDRQTHTHTHRYTRALTHTHTHARTHTHTHIS